MKFSEIIEQIPSDRIEKMTASACRYIVGYLDAHQIKLAELARRSHIRRETLSRYLHGRRKIKPQDIDAIFAALGLDILMENNPMSIKVVPLPEDETAHWKTTTRHAEQTDETDIFSQIRRIMDEKSITIDALHQRTGISKRTIANHLKGDSALYMPTMELLLGLIGARLSVVVR